MTVTNRQVGASGAQGPQGAAGPSPYVDTGHVLATPVTGGTVNIAANIHHEVINPAGTLATLTVNLPPTPTDGQLCSVSFTQIITALTLGAQSSKTVVAGPGAAAVGSRFQFIFHNADSKWYPA